MLRRRADCLETLRQRATCPICKEFYTTPKRLGCSHVFCLDCLKRHLQVHGDVNYPPCPMCRCPIRKSYSKVTTLEPARAEEEIVDFVRQFETCGLCTRKENPSVKCIDCEYLLCDDCRKCHDVMKPNHIVVSITSYQAVNQDSNFTCLQHGKPLNKLCVMCERALCTFCEWFDHDMCKRIWDAHDVQDKYRKGFLSEFIYCIDLKKRCTNYTKLPRIVNLHEISRMGRHWQVSDSKRLIQKRGNKNESSKLISMDQFDETPSARVDGIEDVLKLQEIFESERWLDRFEKIRSFFNVIIESNCTVVPYIALMILCFIVMDVFPCYTYAVIWIIWMLSYIHICIQARNCFSLITSQTDFNVRQILNIHSKAWHALVSRSLQILTLFLVASILHMYGLTNYLSSIRILIAAASGQLCLYCFACIHNALLTILYAIGIEFKFMLRKVFKVQPRKYRLFQCLLSLSLRPKYSILIVTVILCRIIFVFINLPDFLWWSLFKACINTLTGMLFVSFLDFCDKWLFAI